MTENSTPDGGVPDDRTPDDQSPGDRSPDDRTQDERAVAALFASLVEGEPGSELSPLEVVRLGKMQVRESIDTRVRRLKVVRNLLVAAALVAAVVLVLPRLGNSSSETAAASMSSPSRASAPAAAPASGGLSSAAAAGGFAAASNAPSAASSAGTAAAMASQAAASSSASSSAAASASPPRQGGTPPKNTDDGAVSGPASSAPVSSGADAPSSAAATSAVRTPAIPSATGGFPSPLSTIPDSSGDGKCVTLSAAAVQAARAAFPAAYFGSAAAPTGCTSAGVVLPSAADPSSSVSLNVRKAKVGACVLPDEGAPCSKTASPDAYALTSFGSASDIWVYGGGYEVYLRVSGTFPTKITTDELVKAGRAVVAALG